MPCATRCRRFAWRPRSFPTRGSIRRPRNGSCSWCSARPALIARLVDDLLDGSRVGTGEFRLQRRDLQLDAILGVAVDACRHAIDAKHLRLVIEAPAEPALVNGDPQRLIQVFSNLLNNASRRSPPGGEVTLATRFDGHQVVITVADEGAGIAPEVLAGIFDLFAVDTQVPLEESGLGIGLAVVRALAEAHGGSVGAMSAQGGAGQRVRRPPAARQSGVAPASGAGRRLSAARRSAVSGRSRPPCRSRTPAAAPRRCRRGRCPPCARGRRVPGMAQVTAGWPSTNFSSTCAQLVQPISAAQSGSGLPRRPRSRPPPPNGMLTMTATPRSAASGSRRCSACAIVERVVDLQEVELLGAQHRLDLGDRRDAV